MMERRERVMLAGGGERENGDGVGGRSSPFLTLWWKFLSFCLPPLSASFSATERHFYKWGVSVCVCDCIWSQHYPIEKELCCRRQVGKSKVIMACVSLTLPLSSVLCVCVYISLCVCARLHSRERRVRFIAPSVALHQSRCTFILPFSSRHTCRHLSQSERCVRLCVFSVPLGTAASLHEQLKLL